MRARTTKTLLAVLLIALSIFMLIPLAWVIIMSFKDTTEIITSSAFALPQNPGFTNYVDAWTKGYIGEYFGNSVFVTSITTLFVIVFGTMAAGNDMVMTSYRMGAEEAYGYMMEAYRAGMVSPRQITDAAANVITAQNRTLKPASQTDITDREIGATREMAEKAIAALTLPDESVAIDLEKKHLFVIQEGNYYKDIHTGNIKQDDCKIEEAVKTLKQEFPNSDFLYISEFPIKQHIENLLVQYVKYDSVVLVLWNRSISYTGSSDATKRMLTLIDSMRDKLSILLFGCPYAAREFGEVKRIIYGYDGKQCQRFAALTLAGKHQPIGKLPLQW